MADRIDWPKPLSSRWNPARTIGWSLDLTARKRRIVKSGLSASPAFAAARASSRRARALLVLRPAGLLSRPRRPLSRGFKTADYPTALLASYQTYRQLSGWNPPPLVTHAFSGHTAISGTRPQFLVPHVAFAHASYSLVRPRREYPRAGIDHTANQLPLTPPALRRCACPQTHVRVRRDKPQSCSPRGLGSGGG